CQRIRLERQFAGRHGRSNGRDLGIAFGVHLAGKSVTGLTSDARPSRMTVHGNGKRKGLDPPSLESGCHLLNHWFVLERRIRIARPIGWFGGIKASLAM